MVVKEQRGEGENGMTMGEWSEEGMGSVGETVGGGA